MPRVVATAERVLMARESSELVEIVETMDSGGTYKRYVLRTDGKDTKVPLWYGRRAIEDIGQGSLFDE